MSTEPSNTDDIIDSRDVIQAIEDYENAAIGRYFEETGLDDESELPSDFDALEWSETDEDRDYLRALRALASEGESLADWTHGETLIRDSYFEDYARDLAEDIGAIPRDASWPATCIDWDRAAWELRMDYTSLDFDGVTYWARS